eukprot:365836-Chlamydomonas_euryale.AAC.8
MVLWGVPREGRPGWYGQCAGLMVLWGVPREGRPGWYGQCAGVMVLWGVPRGGGTAWPVQTLCGVDGAWGRPRVVRPGFAALLQIKQIAGGRLGETRARAKRVQGADGCGLRSMPLFAG